jgi:hypothetical protein
LSWSTCSHVIVSFLLPFSTALPLQEPRARRTRTGSRKVSMKIQIYTFHTIKYPGIGKGTW